jgi:hypothetical protein
VIRRLVPIPTLEPRTSARRVGSINLRKCSESKRNQIGFAMPTFAYRAKGKVRVYKPTSRLVSNDWDSNRPHPKWKAVTVNSEKWLIACGLDGLRFSLRHHCGANHPHSMSVGV